MEIKRMVVGAWETNCYILRCAVTAESVLLDPGAEPKRILEEISGVKVRWILITHGHRDHIGAVEEVRNRTRAAVGIHRDDSRVLPRSPDFFLEDGAALVFGKETLRVLHTPGHSPGGVCLLSGKTLFSGDTIFPNGPGNTAIPGADEQFILKSIHSQIFTLPDDTFIYPGHGPETSVGREKGTAFYPLPAGRPLVKL